eukprot:6200868-Pleurochrysis_carterae.AAC.2
MQATASMQCARARARASMCARQVSRIRAREQVQRACLPARLNGMCVCGCASVQCRRHWR